jgi:ribosomal protein S17E
MSLLKPIYKMSVLTPYEQVFIQTFHHNGNLITEQGTGELKPKYMMSVLTPYEQLFIQTFHHNGNLITEQGTGEHLAINTVLTSATTPKQINTPPTVYSNQLHLVHDSGR